MYVWRGGKTVTFGQNGEKTIKVRFKKSHEATDFRNAISLENKKSYSEAIRLIKRYNGRRI